MKSTLRRRRSFALSFVSLCLASVSAGAQTAPGWEVQFDVVHMNVKGASEHLGDVTRITSVQTFSPPQIVDTITHDPFNLDMAGKTTFRTDVTYRGRTWGFGVGGWHLHTEDSLEGHVTSPADVETPSSYTMQVNTVLMWNELLPPVRNDLEPSGYSPVDYRADGRLRTTAVDAFASAALVNTETTRLDLILGGKIGRIESAEEQGLTQRAFVLNRFRPLHFNNNISLSSTADAEITGAGPMVGIAGQAAWRRLHLRASLTQSVLLGSADQSGTFSDVDAVTLALGPAGPYPPCPLALANAGCYSVSSAWDFSKSENTMIPVTDVQLKVLVDVIKHVAVGVSSFTSIWNNVPAPPAFRMTHSDAGPGLDWELPERSLRFGSVGLVVNVRF